MAFSDRLGGNSTKGLALATGISVAWATIVGLLGFEDMRPWGSCFLQYLWEFALGMWLAEKVKMDGWTEGRMMSKLKIWHILVGMITGMGLSAMMAWNGGFLKLYNDIPSLVGYTSMLLLVYKLGIKWVKWFFCYTSKIGYEWYLVHSLTFIVVHHYVDGMIPIWMVLAVCLLTSYAVALFFSRLYKKLSIIKK